MLFIPDGKGDQGADAAKRSCSISPRGFAASCWG